jgi:DNA mismatch repair protein MutS2
MASTHLEPLKGFAATHPQARNASVEFDAERLEPTFRLVYDRPGASYALAIGARLGLPSALIERAQAHRSMQTRQLQELLSRLDARDRQEAERAALIERREAETAGLLARARAELESARDTARETVARARTESQRLLSEIRRTVSEEWERLKRDERTRESLERSRRRLIEASRAVAGSEVEAPPEAGGPARPGDRVEVAHLGLHGEVVAVDGQTATVRAGSVTVKLPLQGLRVVQHGAVPSPLREEGRVRGRAEEGRVHGIRTPEKSSVAGELHLVGRTTEDARDLLEKYLDDAFLAGLPSVRIIHGKGTGALRRTVAELLESHPLVAEHRLGAPHEGGDGATVARLGTV